MMHSAHVQLTGTQGKAGDKLRMRTWIEVQLVGEDGKPIHGEAWTITIPGGKAFQGTLDASGVARVDGIPAGTCQVTFPKLDKEAWVDVHG
jgi:hypothetical protein